MSRKRWLLLLAGLYILAHLVPYSSIYASPNDDVANVLPVMFELHSPGLYPGGELAEYLHSLFLRTAPVYFYLLAYPIGLIVHPAHAMNLLGVLFSLLLFGFAGGTWESGEDWLRGILEGIVFLHLSMEVNPLLGMMRSFLVVALAAVFWIQQGKSRWLFPVLILISSGVYPPAGLLVITYVFLRQLIEGGRDGWSGKTVRYLSVCALSFLLPLIPYLTNLLFPTRSWASHWVKSIGYELGSLPGILNTFVVGWGPGSLFMTPSTRTATVVFSILGLVQFLFLGRKKYRFRDSLKYLLGACLFLWLLSHLLHPHLYQPNRYTRAVLPFVACVLFADNLFGFSDRLTRTTRPFPVVRWLLVGFSAIPALVYGAWRLTHPYGTITNIHFLGGFYMGHSWPGFVFGLPLVLCAMFVPPDVLWSNRVRGTASVAVLVLLLFYPHCWVDCPRYSERGRPIGEYRELFKYLHATPTDTRVAGPPSLMDPVLAFGRRGVPFRHEQNDLQFVCRRMREFAGIYYASKPDPIHRYLRSHEIDYLLVDLSVFRNRNLKRCGAPLPENTTPILDRPFPTAEWSLGDELYLVSADGLRRALREHREPDAPPSTDTPGRLDR